MLRLPRSLYPPTASVRLTLDLNKNDICSLIHSNELCVNTRGLRGGVTPAFRNISPAFAQIPEFMETLELD